MALLPINPNTFANSPLDRAANRRRDAAWLAEAQRAANAQFALFHGLQPLVLEEANALRCGWLSSAAAASVKADLIVFLGVDASGAPHFALEADDAADPPFADLGGFQEMRGASMRLHMGDAAILAC